MLETYNGKHRGEKLTIAYRSVDNPWLIDGISRGLARYNDGTWWIIPAHVANDDKVADDGPYATMDLAAVSATLQEERS